MPFVVLVAMECWLTWSGMEAIDAAKSQRHADVALLRTAGWPSEAEQQRFLWKRYCLSGEDRKTAQTWIDHLGSPRFGERELAQKRLSQMGPRGICLLRTFSQDPVPERQKRVLTCLTVLEREVNAVALEASVRNLASPAVAVDLWQLLESCPDANLEEEIAGELLRLADRDKNTQVMLHSGDKSPFGAQRACFLLEEARRAPEMASSLWKKAKDAAPHWPCFQSADAMPKDWEIGPTRRTRRAFEQFLDAMRGHDRAAMTNQCHLPFFLGGRLVLNSSTELEELLTQTLDGLKGKSWTCHIHAVLPLEAYSPSEEERTMLAGFSRRDIRVMRVRMTLAGERGEEGHFFMLVQGRPKVLGIAQK